MLPQTIAEKILSKHVGKPVYAGELCVVPVDGAMATDTTGPLAIKAFREMGGERLANPERFHLIIDHAAPAPNERIANLHRMMRSFAEETGCHFYDIGSGICHQVMVDHHRVNPGEVFMGADSHTPTYGAVNALACGVGSTDLAAVMLTGKIWLKVPSSIRVNLHGHHLREGVSAKDIVLEVVKHITISGANYQSVEYHGELLHYLSLSDRMVLCNMVAEMGAKTGIVSPEGLQLPFNFEPVFADKEAVYTRVLDIEAETIHPRLAIPHSPDNIHDVSAYAGTPITYGFIGTCTNGRLQDLQSAAAILKNKKIPSGVRLVIAPASRQVLLDAMKDGTLQILIEAGASIINSGCGPCVGTHDGVPGDGEVVISAANRNFKGRMGNPRSDIYLASPATVAASVLYGRITVPNQSN
ncbi:MAG: 3-isopropylmalate dehydratase large subunit [Bacteroidetes bacterium]|nr:3-isopropylmalate dehydratase large subunit [Bacteroidota bacterium]